MFLFFIFSFQKIKNKKTKQKLYMNVILKNSGKTDNMITRKNPAQFRLPRDKIT